jgi:hypothetical protein
MDLLAAVVVNKPDFLNRFMKKLTRRWAVPIISATSPD